MSKNKASYDRGHKASLAKMQFWQSRVHYQGYVLEEGCRHSSQERVKAIMNLKRPQTKTEMLSLLGLVNYCRAWMDEYVVYDSVLRAATLKEKPDAVPWDENTRHAFHPV